MHEKLIFKFYNLPNQNENQVDKIQPSKLLFNGGSLFKILWKKTNYTDR